MNGFNSFINQEDPTKDLTKELSEITLEKQYSTLTKAEKDLLVCKFLGLNKKPADIMRFISDDYFLGSESITNGGRAVFDYWKDRLKELFPDPLVNKYCYISFGGAIGTGKSFASKIIGLYTYHRLLCAKNLFTTLKLAPSAKIAFGFFHASINYLVDIKFYQNAGKSKR